MITAVIFKDPVQFILDNIKYYSLDNIAVCYPMEIKVQAENREVFVKTFDAEEHTRKSHDMADCVRALRQFVEHINQGQWDKVTGENNKNRIYIGHVPNPISLNSIDIWDIEVWDAFFQLLHNGEILYG